MLFVTKQQAIDAGMTHHGRIYGVPSWVSITDTGVIGAPKFRPFGVYLWLADAAYGFIAANLISQGNYLKTPLAVLRPIKE